MDALGNCGDLLPVDSLGRQQLLPVLVGEPVDRCPIAMGAHDPEVLMLAGVVPSLDGQPPLSLPPYWRSAVTMTRHWSAVYRAEQ